MEATGGYSSGPERGARRRKLAGYLKAANELRQSYVQSYGLEGSGDNAADEDEASIPGAFPDVEVVRNGDEEMVLFPSYARRHHKYKAPPHDIPGASEDIRSARGSGDAEYWKKQWERYENDDSIVDVDIRGWMYSPHRGQMTRKNRLLVGIARHLSGVPAPSSSRPPSPHSPQHAKIEARTARHEDELVYQEAESIARKGQGEADVAWRGDYSERPSELDQSSIYSSPAQSRAPSPAPDSRVPPLSPRPRPVSNGSLQSEHHDSRFKARSKRESWNQPSDMTSAELSVANAHLIIRLKPFLTTPLVGTPLTVFFYNDETSKSRTITTNEAGHFSLRAALDFIPSNVRVLASDKLSATEEVRITEPTGISVISDIDDTIKHSAVGSGAKEIFRNTFIRDLGDLTIDGVTEWYTKMADLGVTLHYVSNSPWQLYPVLTSFFAKAGLPKGSFHLKQYTGMLQGIFEPVAERKKGTLDKIMSDFPNRRFLLVGDSGEADLELYTDIMLANPGRVLGVFIRDVTTSATKSKGFFDSAMRSHRPQSPMRGRPKQTGNISPKSSSADLEMKRPSLPPRRAIYSSSHLKSDSPGPAMGTLIDLDDVPSPGVHRSLTDPEDGPLPPKSSKQPPPSRPSKPLALRTVPEQPKPRQFSTSSEYDQPEPSPPPPQNIHRKPAPPLPPKPRRYSTSSDIDHNIRPSPLSQMETSSPPGSRATSQERRTYRSAVKKLSVAAYNALPSWYSGSPPSSAPPPPINDVSRPTPRPSPTTDLSKPSSSRLAPPVPPRRNISSYPAAAAHYATNRFSGGWSGYNNDNSGSETGDMNGEGVAVLSKKEELWVRRWARAREIFEAKGVVLRSWRVGDDVAEEAISLVESAKKDEERRGVGKK